MKRQSFMAGAIILMIANAVSKILGAVLKIPLAYILREEGMAVYNIAFDAYIMFLAFIISGLPFAVSKMSAEANSRGEQAKEHKIVKISTLLLTVIGLAGTVILYFTAPFFALAMKEEKAVYAIRMIAPSVFFVALGTGCKSYFQGVSHMLPVAASQVAEAVIKLAAGYGLALIFLEYGAEKTAGGAIAGVTIGEFAATAILLLAYVLGNKPQDEKSSGGSGRQILIELITLALPLLCASVASNAINIADTALVRTRLLDAGFTAKEARFMYGAYTGYALTIFHLPVGIIATLGVSILSVIAGAFAVGDKEKARLAANMGIRLSVILSVPCAVAMGTMSREMLLFLFGNDTSAAMLKILAPCAVMMCGVNITTAILQSAGKILTPFWNSLAGSAVKLALSYFLIAKPEINIYGSAISSIAAFTVIMILNMISIRKKLCLRMDIAAIIIKPAVCGTVMYGVIWLISPYFAQFGNVVFLISAGGISCIAYALSLVLTGTVSLKEVRQILNK